MAKNDNISDLRDRGKLAYITLICSGIAITLLAIVAISVSGGDEAITIFNMVLPVIASWVGTILAFYFGRENFESANQQVRELVQKLTPEQRAEKPVTSIMRYIRDMTTFQIPNGKNEDDVKLSEIRAKFTESISRMPIIDSESKPLYILHNSSIDKYIVSGKDEKNSLKIFLGEQKAKGIEYSVGKGYVVVSESATISFAKKKMEEANPCQDIFITKEGSVDEPLSGWISNVRLAKFLES